MVYSFKVTKNSKGWKVTYLHSSSDSESDDPERHIRLQWLGKIACTHHTIAVNTKQIPGRYCKDELTTSRYYIGVTSFVHFLHDQTQSRTEKQMNTEQYSTKPIIQILSSDSESSKWILDYDMWQGEMTTRSTFDWFTNLQKSRSAAWVVIHSTCFTVCHSKSSLRF